VQWRGVNLSLAGRNGKRALWLSLSATVERFGGVGDDREVVLCIRIFDCVNQDRKVKGRYPK
jgi:hypothetical protein